MSLPWTVQFLDRGAVLSRKPDAYTHDDEGECCNKRPPKRPTLACSLFSFFLCQPILDAAADKFGARFRCWRPGRFTPSQLRRLGDVRRNPPGLIFREQLGG